MKARVKITIEVDAIMEIAKKTEGILKEAIRKNKPVLSKEEKDNIIEMVALEIGINPKEVTVKNESLEIIEE